MSNSILQITNSFKDYLSSLINEDGSFVYQSEDLDKVNIYSIASGRYKEDFKNYLKQSASSSIFSEIYKDGVFSSKDIKYLSNTSVSDNGEITPNDSELTESEQKEVNEELIKEASQELDISEEELKAIVKGLVPDATLSEFMPVILETIKSYQTEQLNKEESQQESTEQVQQESTEEAQQESTEQAQEEVQDKSSDVTNIPELEVINPVDTNEESTDNAEALLTALSSSDDDDIKSAKDDDSDITDDDFTPTYSSGSKGTSSSSGRSGGGGGGSYSGGSGGSSDYSPSTQGDSSQSSGDLSGMSLDELKSKQSSIQADISAEQQRISDINSGTDSQISSAQQDCDAKEQAYKEALEQDTQVSDELKTQLDENDKAMAQNETATNENMKAQVNNEIEINTVTNEIASVNSKISALQSALNSLPSSSDDPEKQAEIDAKRQSINKQISEQQAILKQKEEQKTKLEAEKTKLSEEYNALQTELTNLSTQRTEIENNILANCSEATTNAMSDFRTAQATLEQTKTALQTETLQALDAKTKELNNVNAEIQTKEAEQIQRENRVSTGNIENDVDFELKLNDQKQASLSKVKETYEENRQTYEDISNIVYEKIGVQIPPEVICAIHYRESNNDFNTYLHNGEKLGKKTTLVPKGIYFDNFKDAAVDALCREYNSGYKSQCSKNGIKNDLSTLSSCLLYTENFNGFGYRKKNVNSPYVYAGTTLYSGGRYVRDHVYNANDTEEVTNDRLGTAVIISELMKV